MKERSRAGGKKQPRWKRFAPSEPPGRRQEVGLLGSQTASPGESGVWAAWPCVPERPLLLGLSLPMPPAPAGPVMPSVSLV